MSENFGNAAYSQLSASITAIATSLSVLSGHGTRFPAVNFRIAVWDAMYESMAEAYRAGAGEWMLVTKVATDTFTVTRAYEDPASVGALAFDTTIGKVYRVEHVLTGGTLTSLTSNLSSVVLAEDFVTGTGRFTGVGTAGVDNDANGSPVTNPGTVLLTSSGTGQSRIVNSNSGVTLSPYATPNMSYLSIAALVSASNADQVVTNGFFIISGGVITKYIAFLLAAGAANWAAASYDGTHTNNVDTGIAKATGYQKFEIRTTSASASVYFYINGTLVATLSSNLPADRMNFGVNITGTTGSKQVLVDYIEYRQSGLAR